MNRSDLQRLANIRVREANVLFGAGEFSGAYYLSGYAIECALKACFAKRVQRYDFPDKTKTRRVFIHNLQELAELADLKGEVREARNANPRFDYGWDIVCAWSEESRYLAWTREDAEAILDAITHRKDGVLPWIKRRW